jgi:hypothetical protein
MQFAKPPACPNTSTSRNDRDSGVDGVTEGVTDLQSLWQAARCPSPTSRSCGTSAAHLAIASGHRLRKLQPWPSICIISPTISVFVRFFDGICRDGRLISLYEKLISRALTPVSRISARFLCRLPTKLNTNPGWHCRAQRMLLDQLR